MYALNSQFFKISHLEFTVYVRNNPFEVWVKICHAHHDSYITIDLISGSTPFNLCYLPRDTEDIIKI